MANTTFNVSRLNTEFQTYYQTTVSRLKEGHPQYANTPDTAIINIQFDVLWGKIPKTQRIYDFDKMSEYQKSVFYKALIQQIYYVLTEGDFTAMSGYNVDTNTILSPEELAKIAISPAVRKTLQDGGLLYRGLGDANACDYRFRGWKY